MSNYRFNSDPGVWDPNSKIDMWDPSCIGKTSPQPSPNPAPAAAAGYRPAPPSQSSWSNPSQPSSVNSSFNMSTMRESLSHPNQQATMPPTDSSYSDIYYNPSKNRGYVQQQSPAQQLNLSGNNVYNPPVAQPYGREQWQQQQFPGPSANTYTPPPTQIVNSFVNPLNTDDNSESADVKVNRMQQSAKEVREIKTEMMKKPTTISKGALAMLQKDLDDAAAPFQTAEALKLHRDKQLGLLDQDGEHITVIQSSEAIAKMSNLSATAAEFVPRSSNSCFKVRVEVNVEGGGETVLIPKLILPISPDSDRAQNKSRPAQDVSNAKMPSTEQDSGQSWMSPFWLHVSEESIVDPFETNIWQNPMDGPNLKPSPTKKICQSPRMSTPVKMPHQSKCQEDIIDNNDRQTASPSTQFKNSVYSNKRTLEVSSIPFAEIHQLKCLLIPGLCSLEGLGYQSEQESLAQLQLKVKKAPVQIDPTIDDEEAVSRITECVNNLIIYPACFDSTVPSLLKTLRSFSVPEKTVEKIMEIIYDTCISEPNFRYLGAQLCDMLARSETGLPKFRSKLLSKAQKEFENMDTALSGEESKVERARGFTQFVAELFLSLMMERANGVLERFTILGRALLGVVEKLIKHPIDDNIQCAVRVFKLTVVSMEESLKDDGKGSIEKLEKTLDNLIAYSDDQQQPTVKLNDLTCNLLNSLKELRSINWGRVSKAETDQAEWPTKNSKDYFPGKQPSPTDETFMTNEPVFFTPDGVQYTAADMADPDFYNKYLARFENQDFYFSGPQDEQYAVNPLDEAHYSTNPLDNAEYTQDPLNRGQQWSGAYSDWSPGEADQFDPAAAEDLDDYDDEYEQFLKSMGGQAT